MTEVIHTILAWFELVSYSFCLAFAVFRLPAFAVVTPDEPYHHDVITRPGRRLFGLALTAIIVITVVHIIEFLAAPGFTSRQNLPSEWNRYFRTFDGTVALLRLGSASVLLLLFSAPTPGTRSAAPTLMLVPAILLGWTISSSPPGPGGPSLDFLLLEISDLLHLTAASLWGGGAFALTLVVLPALLKQGNVPAAAETSRRYSRMAGYSALVLAITSIINLKLYAGSFSALWRTAYGWVLLLKMLLFYFLVLIWAFNRFIGVPVLRHVSGSRLEGPGPAGRMVEVLLARVQHYITRPVSVIFVRIVLAEAIVLALVFFCSAALKHQAAPGKAKESIRIEQQEENYQLRFLRSG